MPKGKGRNRMMYLIYNDSGSIHRLKTSYDIRKELGISYPTFKLRFRNGTLYKGLNVTIATEEDIIKCNIDYINRLSTKEHVMNMRKKHIKEMMDLEEQIKYSLNNSDDVISKMKKEYEDMQYELDEFDFYTKEFMKR